MCCVCGALLRFGVVRCLFFVVCCVLLAVCRLLLVD